MVRKYVRCNYFEPVLVAAQHALEEDLRELENGDEGFHIANAGDIWDMSGFLDFISTNPVNFDCVFPIGDEFAEIEHDTFIYNQQYNLYSISVSKLRENNIPSKKRLGQIREQILLAQDEYIGEFISFIYDNHYQALMIQSNLYGLSITQLEKYLTELRFRYLNYINEEDETPFIVQLRPIIDRTQFERALNADYYRKIKIKGADFMEDALMGDDMLSDARRNLLKASGVNIEIQISIGRAERTESLDVEEIRRTLRKFNELHERNRPKVEITMLENEEAEIDTVNLIEPRMTDRISVEVAPRTTIGHEYLFQEMLNKYIERRPDIRRLLVRM